MLYWTIPTFDGQVHDLTSYSLYRYNGQSEGVEFVSYRTSIAMSLIVYGDTSLQHNYGSDFEKGLYRVILSGPAINVISEQSKNTTFSILIDWIRINCYDIVYRYNNYFYFKNEKDSLLFKLRWG
jgi:hypothetical protein